MSELESLRAAIQIFAHQLVNVTYDGKGSLAGANRFLTNFEAILESISLLTKSSFTAAIKKTMLQSQLRGEPAVWCWENKEFRDLPYEDFKNALKDKFGKDKDKDREKEPKS